MSLKITIQAFLVLHLFVNISAGLSDYTHLMKKYYLLCGPEYFCLPPIKTHQWEVSPNLSYQHMKVCPECQCDKACIKRGDCCADLYFSFPDLVCVNRTIINGRYEKDRTEQSSALMVTSCPADSKTKSKEKCSLFKDTRYRLRNFPVTGLDFPLSYYNKYCAECNGVKNYTFWTLDINCSFFADFNFLSTIDEVIDMAFDRECIFQAIQDDDTFSEIKQENCFDIDERRTLFTKCNQTGEWLTYDSNIAYACESFYKRKYRLFKNMFCYMCNPSGQNLLAKDMITTCNITGQWMTYDSGLQQACLDLPQTLETKPFKNIFCYLCNKGNDSSQIFVDILGQFYENPINDVEYPYIYYLDITDFNLDFFNHVSKRKMEKDKSLSKVIHSPFALSSFRTNDGTLINITNLLLQKAAMEMREIQVCDSRNFVKPTEYSDCTCDISCLFVRDKCCDDLSLQVPMHCRRTSLHDPTKENTKGIPTLNGCFQETTRNFIKKGCTLPESGDIFSQIPLTKVNGVNYDNFYCVLCNLNSGGLVKKMQGNFSDQKASQTSSETNDADFIDHYLNIRSQFEIWDLNIVCPQYLDYSHYLKVGDVIEIAKRMQCRIRFIEKTEGSHECLLSRGAKIRCADLSDWTYSDKDVEWACNNLIDFQGYPANIFTKSIPEEFDSSREKNYRYYSKGYTNVYCAICKPNSKFPEYFIDNCTLSRDSYLCSYYPRIYYYYPFKNIHCTLCNNISFGSVRDSYHDPGPNINIPIAGINWFPILRNMFSIHDDDTTEVVDSSTGKCKSNQVYDPYKDLCRNITCFSGKYLVNNECIPLLGRTMNLQYSMTFTTGTYRIKEGFSNLTFTSLTDAFVQKVDSFFISKLNVKPHVKVVAMEEYGAEDEITGNDCMFIKSKIFFRSSVTRLLIERYLISLRHRFQDSCIKNITQSNDIEQAKKGETARIKKRFIAEPFYFGYFTAKVSNILLCPQIELDEDEYNTSEVNSFLTLTRTGFENKKLVFNEFATTPSGRLRICLEHLQNINYFPLSSGTISVDMKKKYLWILSLVSSCVSITFLILGLICYIILPRLRTIPGKLIIMLMTSLLFTLIFQQVSYFSVQSGYGCISTAILLHFSWLSVFMCTQMANFHTWRTFTSKKVVSHTSDPILLKYLACIFGTSTCLICINIIAGLIQHSDPFGGYGGSKCFIKDTYMLIALFICPVALISFLNTAFFFLTARAIKLTPKAESNQKKRDDLAIFVRLTTVTGVSWLLQIIDSFLPFTFFTFISTAINSLQGCFIFLAFIVNKRVLDLLRKRLCLADNVNSMQTRSEYLSSSRNTSQL